MDINQRKEQFSRACVHAIATVAGLTIYKPEVDDDSIDMGIAARSGKGSIRCPRLEMQLKCTATEALKKEAVHFSLKRKNYDDLRVEAWTPRILVVMLVPQRIDNWLEEKNDHLVLSARIYWMSLRGFPPTKNRHRVTVRLPTSQRFTVAALHAMIHTINQKGDL